MIERREFMVGGAAIAALSATGAAACSPPNDYRTDFVATFFRHVARRDYAAASSMISQDARLTVVTFQKSQMFAAPRNIVGQISNLLHSQGYRAVGDTSQRVFGGFWEDRAGWVCSDLIRGSKLNILHTCGGNDEISSQVFNTYVSLRDAEGKSLISQILLQASHKLNFSGPYPVGF